MAKQIKGGTNMATFIMLTRLAPSALQSPRSMEEAEQRVMTRIKEECPGVEWKKNLAVMGPYDYLDIFEAPDIETAFKISAIIRTLGSAHVEIWPATKWSDFKGWVRDLAQLG
jgi:uncharacterized protein with GYD domain